MSETLPRSVLPLCLPDPRFSVDFANYAVDAKLCATSKKYIQDLFPGQNKPLPQPNRDAKCQRMPSPRASSREKSSRQAPGKVPGLTRPICNVHERTSSGREAFREPLKVHSLSDVGHSERPSTTPSSTVDDFVLFTASTTTSAVSSDVFVQSSSDSKSPTEQRFPLLKLPQPVLEHILKYVVGGSRTVHLFPLLREGRQWHSPRGHLSDSVDLQQVIMQPIFLVGSQIRKLALDALYQGNTFLADLCNSGRRMTNAPRVVKDALSRVSDLQIRFQVPSIEPAGVRSTGKTVGPQEDIQVLQSCLRELTSSIVGSSNSSPNTHSRSRCPPRTNTLRRKLSFRSEKEAKPPRESLDFTCRGPAPTFPNPQRKALQRLEIVLVKRSATAVVLPETLKMVDAWNRVPVEGRSEYYLEMDGRRRLWAKRVQGKWLGMEPDGWKLFHDLQALRVSTQTAQASPEQAGKARCTQRSISRARESSMSRDVSRPSKHEAHSTGLTEKRGREMGIFPKSVVAKRVKEPPTLEELQQIAADIRRGVY